MTWRILCAVMTPGNLGSRRTFVLGKWNSRRLARAAFDLFLGEHPVDARAKYMSGQCVLYVTNGFTCVPGSHAGAPCLCRVGARAHLALHQAAGPAHACRNSFEKLLSCTHPGASGRQAGTLSATLIKSNAAWRPGQAGAQPRQPQPEAVRRARQHRPGHGRGACCCGSPGRRLAAQPAKRPAPGRPAAAPAGPGAAGAPGRLTLERAMSALACAWAGSSFGPSSLNVSTSGLATCLTV